MSGRRQRRTGLLERRAVTVWEQIRDALRAGEDPLVYVSYSMLAKRAPKRKGPAPKKRVGHFSLYSKTPMGARKTTIQRCWNPYCRKRIASRYVCNSGCLALAKEHLTTALSMLLDGSVGPVEDVPDVPIFDEEGRDRTAAGRGEEKRPRSRRGRKPSGLRAGQPKAGDGGGKILQSLLSGEDHRGKTTG